MGASWFCRVSHGTSFLRPLSTMHCVSPGLGFKSVPLGNAREARLCLRLDRDAEAHFAALPGAPRDAGRGLRRLRRPCFARPAVYHRTFRSFDSYLNRPASCGHGQKTSPFPAWPRSPLHAARIHRPVSVKGHLPVLYTVVDYFRHDGKLKIPSAEIHRGRKTKTTSRRVWRAARGARSAGAPRCGCSQSAVRPLASRACLALSAGKYGQQPCTNGKFGP